MEDFAKTKLFELRDELEKYIQKNPAFASSFLPVTVDIGAPDMAKQMTLAGRIAQTGPMAAVAGAFAEYLGKAIQNEFSVKELVIENGGDIYLKLERDLVLGVYAGKSGLSGKVGIEIPAAETPLGVCTSAGTFGPSVSFGKADAVMVACKSTLLADAYATAIGNQVQHGSDIEPLLKLSENQHQILSILIICEGAIGIRGQYALKLFGEP